MIRFLIVVITLTLLTGSAFGNIEHLLRVITGDYGSGVRIAAPSYVAAIPSSGFSYTYGYGR